MSAVMTATDTALRDLYLYVRDYGQSYINVIHGTAHGEDARARLARLLEKAEKAMAAAPCDGGTCYSGCAHHEAEWAGKLAAAEARVRVLEEMLRDIVERDLREVHPGRPMFDLGWRSPEWLAEARALLTPPAAVGEVKP